MNNQQLTGGAGAGGFGVEVTPCPPPYSRGFGDIGDIPSLWNDPVGPFLVFPRLLADNGAGGSSPKVADPKEFGDLG